MVPGGCWIGRRWVGGQRWDGILNSRDGIRAQCVCAMSNLVNLNGVQGAVVTLNWEAVVDALSDT